MRRLRRTKALRDLVRETDLSPRHLVQPLFVVTGENVREPVESMPGVDRFSINELVAEASELLAVGIEAVILFGIPDAKDETGTGAYDDEGVVQLAVRALKQAHPDLTVITDVCLCEYTSHGHCGFVRDGSVDNDITLELLAKTAISHAEAGADVVAPSDMMDGRIGMIRHQLNEEGHPDTAIIAYSAKYASAFYGPFREAAESTPEFGDRRGYQMDPANAREALREVKPRHRGGRGHGDDQARASLSRRDPHRPRRDGHADRRLPGVGRVLDDPGCRRERLARRSGRGARDALTSIRRAGADVILTYYAKQAAGWLAA